MSVACMGVRGSLTDVTPNRSPNDRIVPPNNRVHKLVEASDRRPDHVRAGADIPCLQVPRERDQDQDEAEEREDGKKRVGWVHHLDASLDRQVCARRRCVSRALRGEGER